jgi:large subunit ribosomal protein L29
MAKKKAKENVQEMSVKELEAQLRESLDQNFKLKFQHATNPLKNPMQIRTVRRQIARLHTVLRQKAKVA